MWYQGSRKIERKTSDFPTVFKIATVCSGDVGPVMQEYPEKKGLLSQPRRKLVSIFELINGLTFTPLLLFYLKLGLLCTKIHRIVEYTPAECSNIFAFLCNPLPMVVVKRTRTPNPVLLQKVWVYLQTAHVAISLRIAVAIQFESLRMIKRQMQRSTIKCSRAWGMSATNITR